ncbi:NAD(P)H-binding protein [Cellulophaga baltica]|uniref:NmrA family NAD(P)-binding protein n=1 Tax=Cellulophaga baltica TaxID=76594 RepID=UPI0021498A8D|nr:NAD(P)H-binding protein [Cellulophaga baltica]MCR1026723.1 NAD(P)H-binding protein [Cellulophaga baltica]
MKIAIAGATGNVGKIVIKELAKTDHELVLLVKDINAAAKVLEALNTDKTIIQQTNILNTDEVVSATKDCDVLFWMVPPIVSLPSLKEVYDKVITAGTTAVAENNINRAVIISSLGAHRGSGLGTISYVGIMEDEFKKVTDNVMAIRPGYFMENFILQKESILNKGFFTFPFDDDHKIPFVSSDDIGFEAAKHLANGNWKGHLIKRVIGPENLTCKQIENIFTEILGRPVVYKQESYDAVKKTYAQFGLNEAIQEEFYDLLKALGDKNGAYSIERTAEDSTPTTLQSVIKNKILLTE